MASGKRCHYEVLGLERDCSSEEIRSAYKRLALLRHPDKLVQSGLSQAEATAQFQELQHAYEVLSDPKERAWYDSHRSQILFSDPNSVGNSVPNSVIPNLFSFFSNTVFSGYSNSGKGFYKVYSDVFDKIHSNELCFARTLGLPAGSVRQAPVMGDLDSPYAQVMAFYNYWLGFCTVMDFCWVDQYDVMAGPNRKSRRVMEEENKKLRKKAKREYNETVRGLAEFVKKRDKRVIDMTIKKNKEMEKRKEEERERKKRLEKEKMERAMAFEEPEWAKVEEEDEEDGKWFDGPQDEKKKNNAENELYCVICGKKFKSEKQWKNHEQSKKHKEKVAQFKESLGDEDEADEVVEGSGRSENESGFVKEPVDDLEERIRDGLNIAEETAGGIDLSDDDNGFFDAEDADQWEGVDESISAGGDSDNDEMGVLDDMVAGERTQKNADDSDNDEMDILEAMVAGHRSRETAAARCEPKASVTSTQDGNEDDRVELIEHQNRKGSRKNNGANKERGNKKQEEAEKASTKDNAQNIKTNGHNNSYMQNCSSQSLENESNARVDEQLAGDKGSSDQHSGTRGTEKKGLKTNGKNASKGKKAKATTKNLTNM